MIRDESHDPAYTQIPNGLSGALTAEAKDTGPSDTWTPWHLTQDTLTFCFKGQL